MFEVVEPYRNIVTSRMCKPSLKLQHEHISYPEVFRNASGRWLKQGIGLLPIFGYLRDIRHVKLLWTKSIQIV
jgi:hypothetical protein